MTDTFFSSSEKRAMGTVLLTLVWPENTDSLVRDSLPSGYDEEEERQEKDTPSVAATKSQTEI